MEFCGFQDEFCGFQDEFNGLSGKSLDFLLSFVAFLLNSMDFLEISTFPQGYSWCAPGIALNALRKPNLAQQHIRSSHVNPDLISYDGWLGNILALEICLSVRRALPMATPWGDPPFVSPRIKQFSESPCCRFAIMDAQAMAPSV